MSWNFSNKTDDDDDDNSTSVVSGTLSQTMEDLLGPNRFVLELLIVISAVGLLANSLTLVVLSKCGGRLSSHYLLVYNQCVSDTLICLFTFVERSLAVSELYTRSEICLCVMMVTGICRLLAFVVTLLNMLVITVSRLVAVWRPSQYRVSFTRPNTLQLITAMYVVFGVLTFAVLSQVTITYALDRRQPYCLVFYSRGGANTIDVTLALLFATLFVSMPIVYVYIAFVVTKREPPEDNNAQRTQRRQRTNHIVMTSFWIVITFILCFAPYAVVRFVIKFGVHLFVGHHQDRLLTVSVYLGLLPALNCLLDPIIYFVCLPKIRSGYSQIWRKFLKSYNNSEYNADALGHIHLF